MLSDENWFTEVYPKHGSALSLKVTEKLHEEQTPFQRILTTFSARSNGHAYISGVFAGVSSRHASCGRLQGESIEVLLVG